MGRFVDDDNSTECIKDCPLFIMKEVEEVVLSMKNQKGLGSDGIPVEVYKKMLHHRPDLLLGTCNACLKGDILLVAVLTTLYAWHSRSLKEELPK